ncbi:MAG: serine/threonine protein phosphatase [Candidatus Omnitrophica bacterium]|nr:serine/threonine protein phosphatase [Candidatus Omnitrophota bacterium]
MKRLINLPEEGKAIIVGDTHGDFNATRLIVKNYSRKDYYIIFLGDYVDRGRFSRENIDYLLEMRKKYPRIILLAGNHEMYSICPVTPDNFWKSLTAEESNHYSEIFRAFPIVVSGNGFIALHGGLPDIEKIEDVEKITENDENWIKILWGDFRDKEGEILGNLCGRIKLGRDYFFRIMDNIKKNVLIRSHDPVAPERMYENRCLTLFTSESYGSGREIALINLDKEIKTIDDIEIIRF